MIVISYDNRRSRARMNCDYRSVPLNIGDFIGATCWSQITSRSDLQNKTEEGAYTAIFGRRHAERFLHGGQKLTNLRFYIQSYFFKTAIMRIWGTSSMYLTTVLCRLQKVLMVESDDVRDIVDAYLLRADRLVVHTLIYCLSPSTSWAVEMYVIEW